MPSTAVRVLDAASADLARVVGETLAGDNALPANEVATRLATAAEPAWEACDICLERLEAGCLGASVGNVPPVGGPAAPLAEPPQVDWHAGERHARALMRRKKRSQRRTQAFARVYDTPLQAMRRSVL